MFGVNIGRNDRLRSTPSVTQPSPNPKALFWCLLIVKRVWNRSRMFFTFTFREGNIERNSNHTKFTCRRILYVYFWRPRTGSNIATFLQCKDETAIANNNFTCVKSFKDTTFLRYQHQWILVTQFTKYIQIIFNNRKEVLPVPFLPWELWKVSRKFKILPTQRRVQLYYDREKLVFINRIA